MPTKGHILVIDDNGDILEALEMLLKFKFDKVSVLPNPNRLPSLVQAEKIDIILLDMNFASGANSGNEGLYWIKEILRLDPEISIITITAYGDVSLAVKALKLGAADFVLKPWDNAKLIATIEETLKLRKAKASVADHLADSVKSIDQPSAKENKIIGSSTMMQQVLELVSKVASTDANVLVTGENGTGKELIARQIHQESTRAHHPLISVDLGSINDNLLESELFGHVKGAFTDAANDRMGKFEAANKGTLFLDEIGNLPSASQRKILSAIQTREIIPVGSNTPMAFDIRLVCATNASLTEMVENGGFREDLLYRINTIEIALPALRERTDDIRPLADHFLEMHTSKYKKPKKMLTEVAYEKLCNYSWPGNIRELGHMIEKAVILSDRDELGADDFQFKSELLTIGGNHPQTLSDMERAMIIKVVNKHDGNMSATADELGVTRQTLYNKIKKYDLESHLTRNER